MNDDTLSPQERALFEAAESGNTEQARALLDQGAAVDCRDRYENTPLIQAARYGHLDTVELLLQRGAELEAYSDWNTTAFLAACESGNIALIRLLLAKGANAYAESVEGDRALHYAAHHDSPELVDLLAPFSDLPQEESTGGGGSALQKACSYGNLRAAERMLAWGISANTGKGCASGPVLWSACSSGNLELVQLLLNAGADPLAADFDGQQAIGGALCAKPFNPAVAELMLQLGNDINCGDEAWDTPLATARLYGTEEAVAWALAHGAIDCSDENN